MSIQELINNELLAEREARKDRQRSGKWSPSLFGCCYRRQYWNREDIPQSNPPDERSLRVFKCGNVFHDWVENLITKIDPKIQKEVKIEVDDTLGFCDLVNHDTVYDIKSQHSRAFWHMERSSDIKKDKYQNCLQCAWYAWSLGKEYFCLVFISKDDLTIAEYKFPLDDYWKNELKTELGTLNEFWVNKQLPPATPRAYNGKECQYCAFKTTCDEKESK